MPQQKWFARLRGQIKDRCGLGWGISDRNGDTQLTRRINDGKQDLITWQDAKVKGTKRIRDCGAKGFRKAIAGLEAMGLGERLQAGSVPAFKALKPWP